MSGDTKSSSSKTVPTDPDVAATASKLAKGISTAYDTGPQVFGKSLFSPAGATTQDAWQKSLAAAGNPDYAGGVNRGMSFARDLAGGSGSSLTEQQLGGVARGENFGQQDPSYARFRSNLMDDAVKNVGAGFTSSGRFGGGSYTDTATKSAVDAVAPYDYQNRQNDIARQERALGAIEGTRQQGVVNAFGAQNQLPALFAAGLQPSATRGAVGGAMDTNQSGILQGEADLQQRQASGWTDLIAKLTSAAAGNAATSGSTTTEYMPWWKVGLGAASTAAGVGGKLFGG